MYVISLLNRTFLLKISAGLETFYIHHRELSFSQFPTRFGTHCENLITAHLLVILAPSL